MVDGIVNIGILIKAFTKAIDIRQQSWFLATVITVHDRNNGRAYATVLCPSVVCLSSVMYCG